MDCLQSNNNHPSRARKIARKIQTKQALKRKLGKNLEIIMMLDL
jgi:hypothetical protein